MQTHHNLREEFMAVSAGEPVTVLDLTRHGEANISSEEKYAEALALLTAYMPRDQAARKSDECFARARIERDAHMTAAKNRSVTVRTILNIVSPARPESLAFTARAQSASVLGA